MLILNGSAGARGTEDPLAAPAEVPVPMPPVDDEKVCVICCDALGDHVMVPCGHGGYCGRCARDMCTGRAAPHDPAAGHLCPVCRAPVKKVVKVPLGTPVGQWTSASCKLVVQRGD